jgi:hypothetical protein
MIFSDQADDQLHRELLNNQVYSLRDFHALNPPEEGRLMDVLAPGGEQLSSQKWIAWLVQKHRCTRVATVEASIEWVSSLHFDPREKKEMVRKDLFPLESWNGAVLVGCCRPDALPLLAAVARSAGVKRAFAVAISPSEVNKLRHSFAAAHVL